MSIAAGVWRHTFDRATALRKRAFAVASPERNNAEAVSSRAALKLLVQRLFFSSDRRSRVLFIGADSDTPISNLCERVGRAFADISRAKVVIVASDRPECAAADSFATGTLARGDSAVQLADNLWRIPFSRFEVGPDHKLDDGIEAVDYFILGADISDAAVPGLCQQCDGAVLVVTANRTRGEAALRAKELLLGWNVTLLGTVLDNRSFPVPEAIYRRL